MSTPIQELTLQIENNASDVEKPLKSLATALKELKSAAKGGFKGVENASEALSGLAGEVSKIDEGASRNLARIAVALSALRDAKLSPSVPKNLQSVVYAIGGIDPAKVAALGDMAAHLKTLSDVGKVSVPNLKNAQSAAGESAANPIGAEPSTVQFAPNEIDNATNSFTTFSRTVHRLNPSVVLNDFAKSLRGTAAAASSVVKGITGFSDTIKNKFTLGILGGENAINRLFAAFKRIALYRGIRFLFKELTNSFKEGMNNLYQYSLLMGTEFAGSMDRLATAFLYFKNSVGAAASPIVNALAPAIDYAIDKIVQLLNWINQLISRLRGASTWTKAVKYATSYAGAADRAAGSTRKAAQALKDYTIGIDELNVIRPDDDTGSGGGSGSGSDIPDYSKMFEEVPIDNAVSDFADRLKDAFNKGNWKELGQLIGKKVNTAIDSIKWDKIGKKLGKGINGAVQTLYYTLDTIDWTNLGSKVATLLNNALSNIDFGFVGRILVKGVTIGFDLLIGFIKELDFAQLATSISQFLIGAMNEASDWVQKVDWEQLGTDIWNAAYDMVTNIDWGGIISAEFTLIASLFGGVGSFAWGFLTSAWEDLKSAFEDEGELTWESFAEGIKNGISNIDQWVFDNIRKPLIEACMKALGIGKDGKSKEMNPIGQAIVFGILQGITTIITGIAPWTKTTIFDPMWDAIIKAYGISGGESSEMKPQGESIVNGVYAGVGKSIPTGENTFTGWASSVLNWFSGTGNNSTASKFGKVGIAVGDSFKANAKVSGNSSRTTMTTWAGNVLNWFSGSGNNSTASKFGKVGTNIGTSFASAASASAIKSKTPMTSWGGNVKTWFSNEASPTAFSGFALNVVDGFKNGITNFGSRAYNAIVGWAKDVKKWFSKEMDEHSPSKVFYGFGENVVLGFNNAITDVGRTSLRTVQDWSTSIQRGFDPMLSVDYSNIAGMNDYVGAMSATASYNASVQAEASFVDESLMPVLQAIAEATTRQANKSETAVVRVNGRDLLSAMDTQRKANGYRVAY